MTGRLVEATSLLPVTGRIERSPNIGADGSPIHRGRQPLRSGEGGTPVRFPTRHGPISSCYSFGLGLPGSFTGLPGGAGRSGMTLGSSTAGGGTTGVSGVDGSTGTVGGVSTSVSRYSFGITYSCQRVASGDGPLHPVERPTAAPQSRAVTRSPLSASA